MSEEREKTYFTENDVILYDAEGNLLTPMDDLPSLLPGIDALLEHARLVHEKTCQLKKRVNELIRKPLTQKELSAGKAKSKK